VCRGRTRLERLGPQLKSLTTTASLRACVCHMALNRHTDSCRWQRRVHSLCPRYIGATAQVAWPDISGPQLKSHTTIYVSSYYYYYMCPLTTAIYVSSYYFHMCLSYYGSRHEQYFYFLFFISETKGTAFFNTMSMRTHSSMTHI
jgi:hypothetical protein